MSPQALHRPLEGAAFPTMATGTEQVIRARLGAARLLLQRAQGAPNHASLSYIQASAVVEGLRGMKVSAELAASLAERVLEVKFADDDSRRVLAALQPAEAPSGQRRASQDYEAIVNYATQDSVLMFSFPTPNTHTRPPSKEMLTALSAPGTGSSAQLDIVLRHMLNLGCRCPTENTMKLVTSWWLVCSETPEMLMSMQGATKYSTLRAAKRSFDQLRRLAPAPPAYILRLPHAPSDLFRDHPMLYAAAFGDKSPVALHGDMLSTVRMVDASYTCRRSRSFIGGGIGGGPAQAAPALERIAAQMLEGQQRLLAALVGGQPAERQIPITYTPTRRTPTLQCLGLPAALPGLVTPTTPAIDRVASDPGAATPQRLAISDQPPAAPVAPEVMAGATPQARMPPPPATPSPSKAVAEVTAQGCVGPAAVAPSQPPSGCTTAAIEAATTGVGKRALEFMAMMDLYPSPELLGVTYDSGECVCVCVFEELPQP